MWGSDLIAKAISDLGFQWAAINPGASYRGLHDSFVNYLDNRIPLLVCLHEEHAVALAHGWTKVTEKPALAIVHSNVGLMHACMAIYNAWVDRAPVVTLNATGPLDATLRRPWIEWIHTSQDHGALVRGFTKWDDLVLSPRAAVDALAEATFLANADPKGPTFLCLDVGAQECLAEEADYDLRVLSPAAPVVPQTEHLTHSVQRLARARKIVILAGRTTRSEVGWKARIALAERLGAAVITDIKTAASFPLSHPNSIGSPGFAISAGQSAVLRESDAIISLDWIDLDTAVRQASDGAFIVACSLDPITARGWVKNTYRQAAVDVLFPVTSEALVEALLAALPAEPARREKWWTDNPDYRNTDTQAASLTGPAYERIARGLAAIRLEGPVAVTRYPLGWPAALTCFDHPLDYLGRDGGEGLASGPGIAVGVALALKGTGRLPVAIVGDGDFAMGATALWTAARERLPLLIVVAANGVYGNDVVHQERIALARQRPTERRWIGQRIDSPRIDIAGLARSLGITHAKCVSPEDVTDSMIAAARQAREGGPALIEVEMTAS